MNWCPKVARIHCKPGGDKSVTEDNLMKEMHYFFTSSVKTFTWISSFIDRFLFIYYSLLHVTCLLWALCLHRVMKSLMFGRKSIPEAHPSSASNTVPPHFSSTSTQALVTFSLSQARGCPQHCVFVVAYIRFGCFCSQIKHVCWAFLRLLIFKKSLWWISWRKEGWWGSWRWCHCYVNVWVWCARLALKGEAESLAHGSCPPAAWAQRRLGKLKRAPRLQRHMACTLIKPDLLAVTNIKSSSM